MLKKLIIVIVCLVVVSCVSNTPKEARSVSHFLQKMVVNNDPLNPEITYSTRQGNDEANTFGVLTGDSIDPFMIAIVNKQNKSIKYGVAVGLKYLAMDWRFYQQANYASPAGAQRVKLEVIQRNHDCSTVTSLKNCSFEENVAFEVPESVLKSIIADSKAKGITDWDFKIVGKQEHRLKMPISELEAILQVVK